MKKRFLICCVCLVCLLTMSAFAAAPVIIQQPQTYYFSSDVTFPATAYFSVLASGDNLSYRWAYSNDGGETWTNAGSASARTANFQAVIPSNALIDNYLYRCTVSSTTGSVTTSSVSASVPVLTFNLVDMLGWIDDVATNVFSWASDACSTIVQQPLLLFTVGFLALGGAIGIVSRLLSRS